MAARQRKHRTVKAQPPGKAPAAGRAKRPSRAKLNSLDRIVADLGAKPALPSPEVVAAGNVRPPEMAIDTDPRRTPTWYSNLEKTIRAGGKPLEDMAFEYGITEDELVTLIKARGWDKPLAALVIQQAKAIEIKALADSAGQRHGAATESVTGHGEPPAGMSEPIDHAGNLRDLTQDEVVEAAAHVVAGVMTTHRRSVLAARTVVETLVGQLSAASNVREELVNALALDFSKLPGMAEAPEKIKAMVQRDLMDAIHSALALGGRSKTAANLAVALDKLIRLERVAHGLDAADKGKGPGAGDDFIPVEERVRRYTEQKMIEGSANVHRMAA